MKDRKPPVGRSLRYWPAPDEKDPTGAPMQAKDGYAAAVSLARDDDLVHVIVTVDGGNNDFGLGIKVARIVPLVGDNESALALGAHCTWD